MGQEDAYPTAEGLEVTEYTLAGADQARACFDALVGATGITAEAREITNDNTLTDEQALHVILDRRFGHLSDREAYAACARRYGVGLPA